MAQIAFIGGSTSWWREDMALTKSAGAAIGNRNLAPSALSPSLRGGERA
jgi:hypothetical protein